MIVLAPGIAGYPGPIGIEFGQLPIRLVVHRAHDDGARPRQERAGIHLGRRLVLEIFHLSSKAAIEPVGVEVGLGRRSDGRNPGDFETKFVGFLFDRGGSHGVGVRSSP